VIGYIFLLLFIIACLYTLCEAIASNMKWIAQFRQFKSSIEHHNTK